MLLESIQPGEVLFDYCYYPYPPKQPLEGKWRSSVLLLDSLEFSSEAQRFHELIAGVRRGLGENRTVVGIKKLGDQIFWELYFYNYGRADPRLSPSNLVEILRPHLRSSLVPYDWQKYFMISVDVSDDLLKRERLSGLHVYVHNVEERPTGTSYLQDESGIRMENNYAFYRHGQDEKQMLKKVRDTALVDFTKVRVDEILREEYQPCRTICLANKASADAVYFSGIDIDQFLRFLHDFEYPDALVKPIEENRSKLDHLTFDIGWDYRAIDGRIEIVKSGYYGII